MAIAKRARQRLSEVINYTPEGAHTDKIGPQLLAADELKTG